MIITRQQYLKGRDVKFPISDELSNNANKIIARASELLSRAGIEKAYITSGYRPAPINAAAGGSPNSQHIYCNAIDIFDKDKSFGQWCTSNIESLIEIGLWMETLATTHAGDEPWVHLQSISPKSGNRIFSP